MQATQLVEARQHFVRRQARASVRGLAMAGAFIFALSSGLIPVVGAAKSALISLAVAFAGLRLMRGLWAARVARHLARGWRARRRSGSPTTPVQDSANRRAVLAMTPDDGEPLVARARQRGLALADRMADLTTLLADGELSSPLRRPVAEELARVEQELVALMTALGELGQAEQRQRGDLLQRLAARLEVDQALPAGLYGE